MLYVEQQGYCRRSPGDDIALVPDGVVAARARIILQTGYIWYDHMYRNLFCAGEDIPK